MKCESISIAFLLVICAVGNLSCQLAGRSASHSAETSNPASAQPASSPTLEEQAKAAARTYVENSFTKCGDSYLTAMSGIIDQDGIYEFKSPSFVVKQTNPITEADKLNGVTWSGQIDLKYSARRRGEQPWESYVSYVDLTFNVAKANSSWRVDSAQSVRFRAYHKIPCAADTTPTSFEDDKRISWVQSALGQQIPDNAIKGGVELGGSNDGTTLYVCRVHEKNNWHPGKLVNGYCSIGYGGKEVMLPAYQIASGKGVWGKAKPGYAGALIGGREPAQMLYVCRANFRESNGSRVVDHGQHPGKVVENKCFFGYGSREITSDDFDVFYPEPQ